MNVSRILAFVKCRLLRDTMTTHGYLLINKEALMITFFTTARAFRGHMGMIQTNAIRSWLPLCPHCEILLHGDDEKAAEIARQFGFKYLEGIECNEHGTPLLNSLFQRAEEVAKHDWLCHLNADIMLTDDFLPAFELACSQKSKYLMAGQRWNFDIQKPWDFDAPNWQSQLRADVKIHGELFSPKAIDYFVFPKGLWGQLPAFAMGRQVLDNWLIYRARSLDVPVIDATNAITIVHQNHDYSFHPHGKSAVKEGAEAKDNLELAGGWSHVLSLDDATHLLTARGLKPAIEVHHLQQRLNTWSTLMPISRLTRFKTQKILLKARRFLPQSVWSRLVSSLFPHIDDA